MGQDIEVAGIVFGLLVVALFLWVCARIARKAGFSGWWSLLMLVPLVNIATVWVFAFAKWPAETGGGKVAEVFE